MRNLLLPVLLVAAGVLLGGCAGESPPPETAASHSDSHNDHDHDHDDDEPETYAAAVAELTEMRDAVKTAFSSDDLKNADGPVHEVGHMLEHLDGLAEKAGLTDEQRVTVKSAQETLFSAFGALDQTIHGKESGKSWDDVGADIDQAIATLQELAPPTETEGTEK